MPNSWRVWPLLQPTMQKPWHSPRAMVSYSTGESGSGADVDKVRKATQLVKERRPELCVDGLPYYDAVVNDSAGKKGPQFSGCWSGHGVDFFQTSIRATSPS